MKKEYLGDGVYITPDFHGVVLTTENGIEATNTVYLEPEVIAALERYIARWRAEV